MNASAELIIIIDIGTLPAFATSAEQADSQLIFTFLSKLLVGVPDVVASADQAVVLLSKHF